MLEGVLPVGSMIAGYRIERVLGTGGMGTVYLAKHPTLPRRDALKVLNAEVSQDAAFRERFVREADIAAVLDHPNIVSIYGRDETDDGLLWIALQYVDGTDAEAALLAGKMTPQRAIHIAEEVAKALDYAHDRNIVHHDVKPANLLLGGGSGDDERVLLSDFGVARPIGDFGCLDGEDDADAFFATLAYAAPEALAGKNVDGRADLYSMACTLFRLLTGRQPFFDSDGTSATIRAHLKQAPPRVSDHLAWATSEIDQVFAKALAKDPGQRFVSVREFAAAAAAAVRRAGPPIEVPKRSAGEPRRSVPAPRPATAPSRPAAPPPLRARPTDAEKSPTETAASPPAAPTEAAAAGQQFDELPEFKPPPKSGPQMPKPAILAAAAAALVVLVVALVMGLVHSPASSPPPPPTASPTTSPAAVDDAAQDRLAGLLPAGYPPGVCRAAQVQAAGAVAAMSCGPNVDTGGPTSATFTVFGDIAALRTAFDELLGDSETVLCPGDIQSPGPWRRRSNLKVAAGTLYCGVHENLSVIAWTTDDDLLLNVVRADRRALGSLYRWWSSHS